MRGFASHQIAVGLIEVAALARPALRRPAMALADIASAAVEAAARLRLDPDLTGGIAFSSAGLVSALAGLRS